MTEVNPILEASKRLINSANAGNDISDILKYLSRENLEDVLIHLKSHRVIFADLFKSPKKADKIVHSVIIKIQEAIKTSEPSPSKPVRQTVTNKTSHSQDNLPKSLPSRLSPDRIVDLLAEKLTTRKEILDPRHVKEIIKEVRQNTNTKNTRTTLDSSSNSRDLKPNEFMTFGGDLIVHGIRTDKLPVSFKGKTTDSPIKAKEKTLEIPSKMTEADEIVGFLIERVVDTEESAIRSALNKLKNKLLNEVVEDAFNHPDTSLEIKSVMHIVQGVRASRKVKPDDSSSTIPAFTNNILD